MKLLVLALPMLLACHPTPQPNPPPGPEPLDAAAGPTCATYCAHVRALGCIQGKPTAEGATCEQVCSNVQTSGYARLDLKCSTNAADCRAVDRCEE